MGNAEKLGHFSQFLFDVYFFHLKNNGSFSVLILDDRNKVSTQHWNPVDSIDMNILLLCLCFCHRDHTGVFFTAVPVFFYKAAPVQLVKFWFLNEHIVGVKPDFRHDI